MNQDPWAEDEGEVVDDRTFLEVANPERTYVSKTFTDVVAGERARFVQKVFDSPGAELEVLDDGISWLLRESPSGRVRIKLLIKGHEKRVSALWMARIEYTKKGDKTTSVHLDGPDARRLIELVRNLDCIPIEGEVAVRVDDTLVRELFADPNAMIAVYRKDPEKFRRLITDDESSRDVIAMAHRRDEVQRFRRLLEDDEYFDEQVLTTRDRKPEPVWQEFFEGKYSEVL